MKINKIVALGIILALSLSLTGCGFLESLFGIEDPEDLDNPDTSYAANVVLVDSDIASNTTWLDGTVYVISDARNVLNGITLTIDAGAIIKFSAEGKLLINDGGTIKANGTSAKNIVFSSIKDTSEGGDSLLTDGTTVPAKGDWYYVWAQVGSNSNVFTYCEFKYAGKDNEAALFIDGATTVDNCIFHDNLCGLPSANQEATLDARRATTGTVITNNVFYNNTWPLAIAETMSLDSSNTFEFDHDSNASTESLKNTHQAIFIYANANVSSPIAWSETDVPFCVFDDIGIDNGGTLIIASEVALKFSGIGFGINVFEGGTLVRSGAIFTSYRDDAVKGDTNADGTASSPADGDWEGLWSEPAGSYINDADIRYADN